MALLPTAMNLLTAAVLIGDAVSRLLRLGRGEYAPSLFGLGLPRFLRPERLAFRAHRDAEREVLRQHGA
jgi:hypothetical protein